MHHTHTVSEYDIMQELFTMFLSFISYIDTATTGYVLSSCCSNKKSMKEKYTLNSFMDFLL